APIVKIVLHRRERRKVFRQGAPLAAGGKNIEDCIEDGPKWPLRRAPDALPLRQQAAQQNPFLSCRVACIAQSNAAILIAGGFGPSHGASLVDSQSRRNHNRLEITRFLFGQSLRSDAKRRVSKDGRKLRIPGRGLRRRLSAAPHPKGGARSSPPSATSRRAHRARRLPAHRAPACPASPCSRCGS